MAKGPLITRSEIRRRQQEEALRAQRESEKVIDRKKRRFQISIVKKKKEPACNENKDRRTRKTEQMEFIFDESIDHRYFDALCRLFSNCIYLRKKDYL